MKCSACGFSGDNFIILDQVRVMQGVIYRGPIERPFYLKEGQEFTDIVSTDDREYLYSCPECGTIRLRK
jgi:hypothetical protein